jgi:hypothetical protein
MKYFIPDWDDRVDPKYDFLRDVHSKEHDENPVLNDAYMWDIFDIQNVPFDGVLISLTTVKNKKSKYQRILNEGIHKVLRLPQNFEIMGDCGAFGYIKENEPPFKTKETLEYYLSGGFNYGVSIDHLIIPAFGRQNQFRWKLTIENAREMFELWQSKDRYLNSIRIIGVAQGWDSQSYRDSVKELLRIGYDYIALGGIARAPTGHDNNNNSNNSSVDSKTVYNIVQAAWLEISTWMKETRKKVDLHVFGVARPELMYKISDFGVSSFDSASHLRKAWLASDKNYLTVEGKFYGALRIPQAVKSSLTRYSKDKDKLVELEEQALERIRGYEMGNYSLKQALDAILSYDKAIGEDRDFEKYYKHTLEDMPWRKCPCKICKEIGIEVIIFRGNNRNRRRGFHNTFAFYNRFRQKSPRIFAFTFCTATKDTSERSLPAFLRYGASTNMKTFWKNVYDLPIEIGMFSAKLGIVSWSDRIANYDYKLKDNDIPKFVSEVKEKLKKYDKVFFIGLAGYKKVVETVKSETGYDIEIFPKSELAVFEGRVRPLDMIEYTKQMKFFRKSIIDSLPNFSVEQQESLKRRQEEISLDKFLTNY